MRESDAAIPPRGDPRGAHHCAARCGRLQIYIRKCDPKSVSPLKNSMFARGVKLNMACCFRCPGRRKSAMCTQTIVNRDEP